MSGCQTRRSRQALLRSGLALGAFIAFAGWAATAIETRADVNDSVSVSPASGPPTAPFTATYTLSPLPGQSCSGTQTVTFYWDSTAVRLGTQHLGQAGHPCSTSLTATPPSGHADPNPHNVCAHRSDSTGPPDPCFSYVVTPPPTPRPTVTPRPSPTAVPRSPSPTAQASPSVIVSTPQAPRHSQEPGAAPPPSKEACPPVEGVRVEGDPQCHPEPVNCGAKPAEPGIRTPLGTIPFGPLLTGVGSLAVAAVLVGLLYREPVARLAGRVRRRLLGAVAIALAMFPLASGLQPSRPAEAAARFVGIEAAPDCQGYWLVASDAGVFAFGSAKTYGEGPQPAGRKIAGLEATPSGHGYWLVATDGSVVPHGDAQAFGDASGQGRSIVGIENTPDGGGYWLVAQDGSVLAFGNANAIGSAGNLREEHPIVAMEATPDGGGYWLVATDGSILPFGNAGAFGNTTGLKLRTSIVGIEGTADGKGYWLATADGGVYAFGDASSHGSLGGTRLNSPIAGIEATPDDEGYWLIAADGGIYPFGDARGYGSPATPLPGHTP